MAREGYSVLPERTARAGERPEAVSGGCIYLTARIRAFGSNAPGAAGKRCRFLAASVDARSDSDRRRQTPTLLKALTRDCT